MADPKVKVLMSSLHPVGGIRTHLRYVFGLADFKDIEITLLAPGEDVAGYFAEHIPRSNFNVQTSSPDPKELIREIRKSLSRGRYDLLHSQGLRTGVAGEIARTGKGVPHMVTIHDVFFPATFSGIRGKLARFGLNIMLRQCDLIHAVGEDCGNNFREFMQFVRAERVRIVTNGIDTSRFSDSNPVDATAFFGIEENTFMFGFFGRFMAQKGFRTIVDAVELMVRAGPTRPFRVVTFGWGGFVREDYQYLQDKGLGAYFLQHPGTDEAERWMKSMDVVLMPSRWEALPLVAMEALVGGVPIIGTNCLGSREVFAGSPAVVIPPGNPNALAAAMSDMLGSNRIKEFREYVPNAIDRFDVSRCAAGIRYLYDELVSRGAAT
jgi:glycosyltransferase involved in cell wall biosynthesis